MSNYTPISLVLGLSASIMVVFSPNQNLKAISTLITGIGFGGFISSQIGNREHDKQIENLQKTVEIVDKQRSQAEKNQQFLTTEFKNNKESLEADLSILSTELRRTIDDKSSLTATISKLETELKLTKQQYQNDLRDISKFSNSSGFEIAQNTYYDQFKKLEGLITGYKRNYPDLVDFFNNLESEIDQIKSRSITELENYEGIHNLQSLIDDGLRIQERIISKCSDIKLKAQTSIIRYLNNLITNSNSVSWDEYKAHLSNLAEEARTVIYAKESERQEVAKKWLESNELTQQRYETEFTETLEQGKHLVNRNQELIAQVEFLKRPLTWSLATRQDLQIGNIIINYFERLGIILDRAKADYEIWQSTLSFHIDRNGRTITPGELNPEGEKLQVVCHTLSPITFGWNSDEGLMTAHLHLSKKPVKAIAETDINKIWKTADKFQSLVKGWSRVRVTGGSESGKSPTAENLAVCILLARGGSAELYNPQTDSVKNYWSIPTVGRSHPDSVLGIETLSAMVNEKSNDRSQFKLTIFDEIDSTMVSVEKKEQGLIGQNISTIIKQVSHQNLGVIFIGQNANASKYPGMDRSDWNSAINVHIGSNAYDALTNTNQVTKDEQTRLKLQADKLTEYCNDKNSEFGLEKTNPEAYRFALVMGDSKPYFMQLPSFGVYTYNMIEVALKCPKCGSLNHISNGQGKRKCKDCSPSFKG